MSKATTSRISGAYREYLEDLLLRNKLKVLVATVALGMGYDKPDLGFVIHFQAPGSIVAYYQQVGRAGRAIDKAYGILITGTEDERIHEYFRRSAFPKAEWVAQILDALGKNDGLTARQLEKLVNLRSLQLAQVLKYLSVGTACPRDQAEIEMVPHSGSVPDGPSKHRPPYQTEGRGMEGNATVHPH